MDTKKMTMKTKQSVEEVSKKLNEIKNNFSPSPNSKLKEDLQSILDKLESLNQEIQKQFDQMNEAEHDENLDMSEIEKNIYNSIESFNRAYTNAGSLFKIH